MGDLSEHFSSWEFACKGMDCCGRSAPMDPRVIDLLEDIRYAIYKLTGNYTRITMTSGFRCNSHNKHVGGAKNSYHTKALAVDVNCPDELTIDEFAAIIEGCIVTKSFRTGLIKYATWIHLDIRPINYRADVRK